MKRKDPAQSGDKYPRVSLNCRLVLSSPEGRALHYLLNNPGWNESAGKSMVMESLRAFWLPFTFDDYESEEAQRVARQSIEALEDQLLLIRSRYNLSHTRRAGLTSLEDSTTRSISSDSLQSKAVTQGNTDHDPTHLTTPGTQGIAPKPATENAPITQTPPAIEHKAPEVVSLETDPDGLYLGLDNALFL